MKKIMLGTAMALILGSAATAQDMFRTEMDPVAITASDFIGKRVYAVETATDDAEYAGVQDDWNDIGEINDVLLTRDGKVDAVLVDIGGFLGMGERQVALGMENIRFVSDSGTPDDLNDYFLVVNADRTVLEGAPEFARTGVPAADMSDQADATNVPAVDQATGATSTEDTTAMATDDTTAMAPEGTDMATDDAAMGAAMPVEGYTAVDAATLNADQLVGARVYGANDSDLGEVSAVMADAQGMPGTVIVDVGGFLGIGEKPVALDLATTQVMQETDGDDLRVYVQMTQEQLESMPTATQ